MLLRRTPHTHTRSTRAISSGSRHTEGVHTEALPVLGSQFHRQPFREILNSGLGRTNKSVRVLSRFSGVVARSLRCSYLGRGVATNTSDGGRKMPELQGEIRLHVD